MINLINKTPMNYLKTFSAILISGLILAGCASKTNKQGAGQTASATEPEKASIPVKVMTLKRSKISRTIENTSTILPFEEVNMAPPTPGRIDKIYVEAG